MENKELRTLSVEQLNKKALEMRKTLFEMRMKNTVGQLNNPIEIRDTRKTIARILTAITAAGTTTPKVAAPKTAKPAKKTTATKTTKAKATKAKAKKK
jgi:large subunit ribosomal protein L29